VVCLEGFDSLQVQLMLGTRMSGLVGEGIGKLTGHMCISFDCWDVVDEYLSFVNRVDS